MLSIRKVRFHGTEKFFNRFYVYTASVEYVVRRPIGERPLRSVDIIMNCKSEEELFKIGGSEAPKGGKMSMDEYFERMGFN